MAPLSFRICLTGPESTGKTELAQRLALGLGASYAPEYSRRYAEEHGLLSVADVEPIARGQMAGADREAAAAMVVFDTDLISTVVYARYYYGACPAWIEEAARIRRADLYLLMDTDLSWVPDGVRDSGGEAREVLFDAFRAALDEFETNWTVISGAGEERWRRAWAVAEEAVSDRERSRGKVHPWDPSNDRQQ